LRTKFSFDFPFFKKKFNNPWLYPSLTNHNYYHLTRLKQVLQEIITQYIAPLREQNPDLVALDMGCGTIPYRGLFTPVISKYISADIALNPLADIFMDQLTNAIPLAPNSIDIIISTQVLEHVESPELYLAEASRLCKPGGLLILSTHGHWIYHPSPYDYWRWTNSGLQKIVEESGFSVVSSTGIMGLASTGLQFFQEAITPSLPRILKVMLVIIMQCLILIADKFSSVEHRNKDASVFVLVARKVAK
jgi:SAM-dependent methyltransferase